MDDADIERENVALTGVERSMNVLPSAGLIVDTVGPATVVKPQDVPANGVPSAALTAVVSRTVYVVDGDSGAAGVNVAVVDALSYVTVPGTAPDALDIVNDEEVRVLASMPRENVAVAVVAVETLPAPAAGVNAVRVAGGGAVEATVNDHTYAVAIETPSIDLIAVLRRALYVPDSASGEVGTRVACNVDGS